MQYITLSQINQEMTADPNAMQIADTLFLENVCQTAKQIAEHAYERPIVLLSGPSGSGKTTTAYLISRFLNHWGKITHTISMDNFFSTMTPTQQAQMAAGKLDLESPARVDIAYLNQTLECIISCQPAWIPRYDFPTTTRIDKYRQLTRKPGEILILEGIHALNPTVITIPNCQTVGVYVSVRTRICQEETVLHPSYLRLVRRMLRDKNFRKRSLMETIHMFEKVQAGERKYITPYKSRANLSVDTFLPYELGVYKTLLGNEIQSCITHPLLQQLRSIWQDVTPLPLENVPTDSLLREFTGGSIFHY